MVDCIRLTFDTREQVPAMWYVTTPSDIRKWMDLGGKKFPPDLSLWMSRRCLFAQTPKFLRGDYYIHTSDSRLSLCYFPVNNYWRFNMSDDSGGMNLIRFILIIALLWWIGGKIKSCIAPSPYQQVPIHSDGPGYR